MQLYFEQGKAPLPDTIGMRKIDEQVWQYRERSRIFPLILVVPMMGIFLRGDSSNFGTAYAHYSKWTTTSR